LAETAYMEIRGMVRFARHVRKFMCVLSLLVAGAMVTNANGQAPGVGDREIKIGSGCALDGPARQLGLQTVLGATTYFNYINGRGGVNGRKLSLVSFDDGYDPEK